MEMTVSQLLSLTLSANGVSEAVVSSGSRSMPLVTAIAINTDIRSRLVVDERVAAFAAVGIIRATLKPAVIVCTSGSAMLNYASAVAEAYYTSLPLIVVTADRPADRIDANEGQTIHQVGALANIVKQTYVVNGSDNSVRNLDDARKIFAEAIAMAQSGRPGPVHINIHLSEPLQTCLSLPSREQAAPLVVPPARPQLRISDVDELHEIMRGKKCAIYIGPGDFMHLAKPLYTLSDNGVLVVAEVGSQLDFVGDIDLIKNIDEIAPEVLITIGGSPLSRSWRTWIKSIPGLQHYSITLAPDNADTYYKLVKNYVADPKEFLDQLVGRESHYTPVEYGSKAQDLWKMSREAPWSDWYVLSEILNRIAGETTAVHCSNGSLVRIFNNYPHRDFYNIVVNRGVNGIDGSTSTALGYASAHPFDTLLITGDMSALYDIGALFSGLVKPNFKMFVFNNGGGEIFRMINCTGEEEMREKFISAVPKTDWLTVGKAAGFDTYRVTNKEELEGLLHSAVVRAEPRPLLVEVVTPKGNSEIYRNAIKSLKP